MSIRRAQLTQSLNTKIQKFQQPWDSERREKEFVERDTKKLQILQKFRPAAVQGMERGHFIMLNMVFSDMLPL